MQPKKFVPLRIPEMKPWFQKQTEDLIKIDKSPYALRGNEEFITMKERACFVTDEFAINPKAMTSFKLMFDVRADCPQTSTFSVTVAFKDYEKKYLPWRNQTGWWHFDYPVLYRKPKSEYETIKIEYPGDSTQIDKIPPEARFIEFGIITNHHIGNTAYRLSKYYIAESF